MGTFFKKSQKKKKNRKFKKKKKKKSKIYVIKFLFFNFFDESLIYGSVKSYDRFGALISGKWGPYIRETFPDFLHHSNSHFSATHMGPTYFLWAENHLKMITNK